MICKLPVVRDRIPKWRERQTLTSACQSFVVPFPDFNVPNVLGIFVIPFKCVCKAPAAAIFSGSKKHSTASWRACITSRDVDGRSSHVRSRERPSAVRVVLRIPDTCYQYHKDQIVDGGVPNSESPSFVLSECIEAWFSFSKICNELAGCSNVSGKVACWLTRVHRHWCALLYAYKL